MAKHFSEKQMRQNILNVAKKQGCEMEIKQIFNKTDRLLKTASESEKTAIATLGLIELHKILNCQEALIINGTEILPAIPQLINK